MERITSIHNNKIKEEINNDIQNELEKDYISGNILKVTIEVKPGYKLTTKDIQLFVKKELEKYPLLNDKMEE
mgnify:CR=1 FL=1